MNKKGFSLVEVLFALLIVSVALMAIFTNIYSNHQNNVKMLSYQLLAGHISNLREDFSALENGSEIPLEYHGVDVNSLWGSIKGGSVGSVKISDNGYEFSIIFTSTKSNGIYSVQAEGREERLYLEYETEFAIKRFKK